MRKWLQVAIPVVAVAVAAVVGAVVPAGQPTSPDVVPVVGQVSAACPAFTEPTAKSSVAVVGDGPVQVGELAAEPTEIPAGRVETRTGQGALRLTGLTSSAPTGTSLAAAAAGPSRGYMLTGCVTPSTESWVVGMRSDDQHLAFIVLVNLDQSEAAVDLSIFASEGQVIAAGSRGIVVAPASQRVVPLGPLVKVSGPISVRVQASAGRIAAVGREVVWQGNTAVGTDWAAPSAAGTSAVLPLVPGGPGARELVVANPGDRSIRVSAEALAERGSFALVNADTLDIPARSTRTVPLMAALQGQPVALRLQSGDSFVATIRAMTAGPGANPDLTATSDLAFAGVGTRLAGVTTIPLSLPQGARAELSLANAGEEDATATVSFTDGAGRPVGQSAAVSVVGGGSVRVQAPPGAATIRIEVSSGALHGAVAVTGQLERVAALGTFAIAPGIRVEGPGAEFDPHVPRG